MESLSLLCTLLAILLISVEQFVCRPFVEDAKNSTQLHRTTEQNSSFNVAMNVNLDETKNTTGLLTYEDLPEDGSMDIEYMRQHKEEFEGMLLFVKCAFCMSFTSYID